MEFSFRWLAHSRPCVDKGKEMSESEDGEDSRKTIKEPGSD